MKELDGLPIKEIEGFEGLYYINTNGDVFSHYMKGGIGRTLKTINKLRYSVGGGGYKIFHLYKNKKRKTALAHRLVAEHFIKRIDGKEFVNHIDGDKLNANISNLEWCTHSENMKHALRTGLNKAPPIRRKLTDEQVLTILTLKDVKSNRELAREFNVDRSCISRIKNGIAYSHIYESVFN